MPGDPSTHEARSSGGRASVSTNPRVNMLPFVSPSTSSARAGRGFRRDQVGAASIADARPFARQDKTAAVVTAATRQTPMSHFRADDDDRGAIRMTSPLRTLV